MNRLSTFIVCLITICSALTGCSQRGLELSRKSYVNFTHAANNIAEYKQRQAKLVYVKGYYRKDGTYVRPHYRTAPDGNPYNNYSYPGNYNPNTGKVTSGNPSYLDNHNEKTSVSPAGRTPDWLLRYSDYVIAKSYAAHGKQKQQEKRDKNRLPRSSVVSGPKYKSPSADEYLKPK